MRYETLMEAQLGEFPDESVEERDLRIQSEKILSYDDQYCADELDEGEMEEAEYD